MGWEPFVFILRDLCLRCKKCLSVDYYVLHIFLLVEIVVSGATSLIDMEATLINFCRCTFNLCLVFVVSPAFACLGSPFREFEPLNCMDHDGCHPLHCKRLLGCFYYLFIYLLLILLYHCFRPSQPSGVRMQLCGKYVLQSLRCICQAFMFLRRTCVMVEQMKM